MNKITTRLKQTEQAYIFHDSKESVQILAKFCNMLAKKINELSTEVDTLREALAKKDEVTISPTLKWLDDLATLTRHMSSLQAMRDHPCYAKIVNHAKIEHVRLDAIEDLMACIDIEGKSYLVTMLMTDITGKNPVPLEFMGTVSEMVRYWKIWYNSQKVKSA